jgi:hypothetical protein
VHRLHHPVAGDLELSYDKFLVAGADRQLLTVYQAEPGSRSEEALAFLAATTPRISGLRSGQRAGDRPED